MKLLITGAWQDAKSNIVKIRKMGHDILFCQYEKEELPCDYNWVEGVICNGLFLYHSIEKFVNLKYIQLTSAGFDRVPVEYIKEHNITIYNASGVYSIPMAEYAVCGVLDIYKRMTQFRKNQQEHKWEKNRSLLELFGKKVCIVGCGSVGTECAKRFRAFGCTIIGINRTVRNDRNYDKVVEMKEIETYLAQADIIILSLPLQQETVNLIDERKLSLVKKGVIIVNISRGKIIEQGAFEAVLSTEKCSAVLDVFTEEPLDENSILWDMKNVIVTPHNSFIGENNSIRLQRLILKNLNYFNKGE